MTSTLANSLIVDNLSSEQGNGLIVTAAAQSLNHQVCVSYCQ